MIADPTRQPRVLIVADAYPSHGWPSANPFIREQALALKRLGCSITVFAPVPYAPRFLGGRFARFADLPTQEAHDGILIERPRFPRGPGPIFRGISGPIQRFWLWRAFENLVRRFRPSIVHAHMATPSGYIATQWAQRLGLPVCVTLHGLDITAYPAASGFLLKQTMETMKRADRVIVISRFLAGQVQTLVGNCRPRVCYTGIDTNLFKPDPVQRKLFRQRMRVPSGLPIFCVAGRMVAEKGLDDVAAVAARVRSEGHQAAWMLIGDGPDLAELRSALTRNVGRERVFAIGAVAHNTMPEYLSAADVLVHLSTREGFGMVVLEAQACGLPVVAYRTGGIPEAAGPSSAVLISPASDASHRRAACAGSLIDLIRDHGKMTRMSQAGVAFANTFRIDERTSELVALYKEIQK